MSTFAWHVRVYYEDTDAGGVVYYANYLKFYERARTEMLRELGYEQDRLMENEQVIFVVRSVQVDYLKPTKFNELIQISADIAKLGPASLTFEQEMSRDDVILSRAMIRIACLDANTMRPKEIPQELYITLKHEH